MFDLYHKVDKILKKTSYKRKDTDNYSVGAHNNWIIPGLVMAGPFPGLDGINYVTNMDVVSNLAEITGQGVNTFICLQKEISPADGTPGFVEDSYRWAFPKFCHYSNYLTEIEYRYMPMYDNDAPSIEVLNKYINLILDSLIDNKIIFIHCAGGHGRTGVISAILIHLLEKTGVNSALRRTQRRHDARLVFDKRQKTCNTLSPSVQKQREIVAEYCYVCKLHRSSFYISKIGNKIYAEGGMSTEVMFAKYYAFRTNSTYSGSEFRVNIVYPEIIFETLDYVTSQIKKLEYENCQKPILYSPGYMSVPYMVELCNFIYLPSQFLVGFNCMADLENLLSKNYDLGIESYAVVGYDGCIPYCIVAWIKFTKMPPQYEDLIKNYLHSDSILMAAVHDDGHNTIGENAIYGYSKLHNYLKPQPKDIYLLCINSCYSKNAIDLDLKIFSSLVTDFNKSNVGERCKFIGDWESALDIVGYEFYPQYTKEIVVCSAYDTKPLYELSYKLAKRFLEINHKKVTGIVANPYIISSPTFEMYKGYLPYCFWQGNSNSLVEFLEKCQNDLPKDGEIWINDLMGNCEKFNGCYPSFTLYTNNKTARCDESSTLIEYNKPLYYERRDYVSLKELKNVMKSCGLTVKTPKI